MNTVAMSMNRTAGQSSLNFALRVLGTAIATVASYLIWYIVDGETPGVIILLWLWIFLAFYVVVKRPKLTIAAIISITTVLLVIGYELQVNTIGVQASEQSGQPAYPTYELAPYRLAAVASGLLVALYVYEGQDPIILRVTKAYDIVSGQFSPTRSLKAPSCGRIFQPRCTCCHRTTVRASVN
jgi:hypothetical protein